MNSSIAKPYWTFAAEMGPKVKQLKHIRLLENNQLDRSNQISRYQISKLSGVNSIMDLFLKSDGIPDDKLETRQKNYVKFINDIQTNTNNETFDSLMKNYNIADKTSEEQIKKIDDVTPIVIGKSKDGKTIYLEKNNTIGDGSDRYNATIENDDIVFEPKLFNYFGGRKSKRTTSKLRKSKRTMRKGRRRRRTSRK